MISVRYIVFGPKGLRRSWAMNYSRGSIYRRFTKQSQYEKWLERHSTDPYVYYFTVKGAV